MKRLVLVGLLVLFTAMAWAGTVVNIPLLSVTGQTANAVSSVQTNGQFKGVQILTTITQAPGAGASIKPTLFGQDPVTGGNYLIAQGDSYGTNGTFAVTFHPGVPLSDQQFSTQRAVLLPAKWFVIMQHSPGGGGFDYTVTATVYD